MEALDNGGAGRLNDAYKTCVEASMYLPSYYLARLWHKYEAVGELCDHQRRQLKTQYIEAVKNKSFTAHATQQLAEYAAEMETHECRMYVYELKALASWASTMVERLKTTQIQLSHFRTNQQR